MLRPAAFLGAVAAAVGGPPVDKEKWLIAHNKLRCLHCVADLVWDDKLAESADAWANQQPSVCPFGHSTYDWRKQRTGYDESIGENIFAWGEPKTEMFYTQGWYDEIKTYNWPVDTSLSNGHFTQIVWRETDRIGCGQCSGGSQWDHYVVCQYAQRGGSSWKYGEYPGLPTNWQGSDPSGRDTYEYAVPPLMPERNAEMCKQGSQGMGECVKDSKPCQCSAAQPTVKPTPAPAVAPPATPKPAAPPATPATPQPASTGNPPPATTGNPPPSGTTGSGTTAGGTTSGAPPPVGAPQPSGDDDDGAPWWVPVWLTSLTLCCLCTWAVVAFLLLRSGALRLPAAAADGSTFMKETPLISTPRPSPQRTQSSAKGAPRGSAGPGGGGEVMVTVRTTTNLSNDMASV